MKKAIVSLAALVLTGAVVYGVFAMTRADRPSSPIQNPPSVQVVDESTIVAEIRMKDKAYQPATLTIKQGQAIRFLNDDTLSYWPASNIHPTHEIYSEFDPKRALQPKEEWVFRFDRVGSWRMHDHLYPFIKGVITAH